MNDFISDFFTQLVKESEIFTVRQFIRKSTTLNLLLVDNKKFLTSLYDYFKDKQTKQFTRDKAVEMFRQFINPIYE